MPEFDSSAAVFSASAEQLSKLLNLTETPEEWTEQDLPALYRHQLSAAIEFGEEVRGAHRTAQRAHGQTRSDTGHRSVKTFRDLFTNANPPIAVLRQAKDYFKKQAGPSDNRPPERQIAYLFYLLSIAAAQIRLHTRITNLSDAEFLRALDWAANLGFLDDEIKAVLCKNRQQLVSRGYFPS